jgi:hypothetical protein
MNSICYPVPVYRETDSYDLLPYMGSPDEVPSIYRLNIEPNRPDRIESTYYLFGRPAGVKFPITEAGVYPAHMKKERAIYYSDLPQ